MKSNYRNGIVLLLAFSLQACSLNDITDTVLGSEEKVEITDICYGTLDNAKDEYRGCEARYEFENNEFDIESIDLLADGTYIVTYGDDELYGGSPVPYLSSSDNAYMKMEVEGHVLHLPFRVGAKGITRTRSDRPLQENGTYTRNEDGNLVLDDAGINWCIAGDLLVVTQDGLVTTCQATIVRPNNVSSQMKRLCRRWTLGEVLGKIYVKKKGEKERLLRTQRLSEEEKEEKCIDEFTFTSTESSRWAYILGRQCYGFHRAKHGELNGKGVWWWLMEQQQTLHYYFTYVDAEESVRAEGENDVQVWFADNNLYMQESTKYDAYDFMDEDDEDFLEELGIEYLRFDCFYRLDIPSYNKIDLNR